MGQVALSVIMLFCGGLFLRSLDNLRSLDKGFDEHSRSRPEQRCHPR